MKARAVSCALVVALAGCSAPKLDEALGELQLDGAGIVFEPTYVGGWSERPVRLRNVGRAPLSVSLSVSGAGTTAVFSPRASELSLEAGDAIDVAIAFAPPSPGRHAAALSVSDGRTRATVPLEGEGRAPLFCPGPSRCDTVTFDADAGVCRRDDAPDGTPCENACLEAPRCLSGTCVGTPKSCDDGVACTVDVCAPSQGCLFLAPSPRRIDGGCEEEVCDPDAGVLVARPLSDGGSCGGGLACGDARVCEGGVCRARPVPDGGCRSCSFRTAWERSVPPPKTPWLFGWADPRGTTFWLECEQGETSSCQFREVQRDGRTEMYPEISELQNGLDGLIGDGVLAVVSPRLRVQSRDGGRMLFDAPATHGLAQDGQGRLQALERPVGNIDDDTLWRTLPDGGLEARLLPGGSGPRSFGAKTGGFVHRYEGVNGATGQQTIFTERTDGDGNVRWAVQGPDVPLAAAGGRLYGQWIRALPTTLFARSMETGEVLWAVFEEGHPLASADLVWTVGGSCSGCAQVTVRSASDGGVLEQFDAELGGPLVVSPELLDGERLLLVSAVPGGKRLTIVSRGGAVLEQCDAPWPGTSFPLLAVLDGQVVFFFGDAPGEPHLVIAVDWPGVAPDEDAWSSAWGGGADRSFRER